MLPLSAIISLAFVLLLASGCNALAYAPGYVDFTYLVNSTWLIAPALDGYGADHFDPFVVETAMWYENYTGKALILNTATHGKSPEQTCREALKAGAAKGYGRPKAIFSPSPGGIGGFGLLSRDFSDMKWVGLPTVDISAAVFLLAKGISDAGNPVPLAFVVRDDDVNPLGLKFTYADAIICSAFLTSACLACFLVNIYKFRLHLIYTTGVTTAKIFFVIDIVANLMRFWYVTVNPFFLSRFAYTWTIMCNSIHVALSIIATLLLALKWRELLSQTKLQVNVFLSTFKWPFIIVSIAIFILETVSSALRGHWYDATKITESSQSILAIVCFVVVVLLFVSGTQILMKVNQAVSNKKRVLQLSQTTILILCSGLGLLLWVILTVAYLLVIYRYRIANVLFAQLNSVFAFIGLFAASFLQNWAMPIPADSLQNRTNSKKSVLTSSPRTVRSDIESMPASPKSMEDDSESEKDETDNHASRPEKKKRLESKASATAQEEDSDDDEEEETSLLESSAQSSDESGFM